MRKLICIMLAMLLLCGCGAQPVDEPTESTWDGLHRAQIQGQEVVFEAWEQEGLPTEGCYDLTKDVVLTERFTVAGELMLHLNGHTVQGEKKVDFGSMIDVAAGGTLVIYDDSESAGAVVSPRSITGNPTVKSLFCVSGTLTLAGGTVDATEVSLEDVANGAAFYVCDGGVLNVTGGTVIGGTTICYSLDPRTLLDEESAKDQLQGQDQPQEEPEIPELLGKGGSIYVSKGGVCHVSGGTIRNGIAGLGGNIYTEADSEKPGKLVVSGGLITEGESVFHGGNIYNDGIVEMSGGEVSLGTAYCNGGNFFVAGRLEMTGGVISKGCSDPNSKGGKRGGNLCVNGLEAVVRIANASILDGTATGGEGFGGNISVMGQCAREFSVTDTTISGGRAHRGGNLYFGTLAKDVSRDNLDFYMSNVTVFDGSASYRGANLCMDSDLRGVYVNLVMDNSTFRHETGETVSLGAGAALDTWATLTMNGGAIEGGSLTLYTDSVLTANGAKLTMDSHGGDGQLIVNP